MDRDNTQKYACVAAVLLLLHRHFGLARDGHVPILNLSFQDPRVVTVVLIICVIWLSIFSILVGRESTKPGAAFLRWSVVISAILSLGPYLADAAAGIGISVSETVQVLVIAIAGLISAPGIMVMLISAASMRSSSEMETNGLHRFAPAATAGVVGGGILAAIGFGMFWVTIRFGANGSDLFIPISITLFVLPILLINARVLLDLGLLLIPGKPRRKALTRLRRFQDCFDRHEAAYQNLSLVTKKTYLMPDMLLAVAMGSNALVERMLDFGVNPDEACPRGWTPLMLASAEGNDLAVEQILSHGADPNVTSYAGRTALMFASRYGFVSIVQRLLSAGASPNLIEGAGEMPALSVAAERGHLEVVELLLKSGADIRFRGDDGRTALDHAMQSSHGEVAKILRNRYRAL